ncbi:hypothetical protein GPECTOR_22g800 [Gonium pectorale]|uniref:PLAT domain-containing protein n=1 Tax=Gonium pectorale TaxID=33097 RepID=A0A150GIK3_GONPE|nr:hypothetical protein GPECTOR_22g800 [Gonium pectorale]|eukprot:KXZ49210.1 hypothetical protein GPECTOR_22g800 [Gonium pectorale]
MSTSSGAYRVQVSTGTRNGAGCSMGAVRLTLYGSQATHVAQLRGTSQGGGSMSGGEELFAEGAVDDFMIDAINDLGDLSAVYIWHEGEGFSASWYVESITIEQLMTGLEWRFDIHDWVRGGQRGGRVVRLPGCKLSISRENSLSRLADSREPGSPRGGSSAPASKAPPGLPAGAGTKGQRPPFSAPLAGGPRRGMAALGDESLDVSSDMPSPVDNGAVGHGLGSDMRLGGGFGAARSGAGRLPPVAMPPGRQPLGQETSAGRVGAEPSTQSGSVHFSDDEDGGEDLLPGMGGGRNSTGRGAPAGKSASAFAGATAAATAASGAASGSRVAANVPTGLGIVLDEDIEEVDGMISTGAFGLGPVSSNKALPPALVSPRPPLPPGAPRRRESIDGLGDSAAADGAAGGKRREPLPPTPPANRRGVARRLSSNLEAESSLDSLGSGGIGGALGGRRRVRISGGGDDGDGGSELSVEGSELSCGSAASLVMYAPMGVRPPAMAGSSVAVDFLGTSRKRVSWAEYAEELEFPRDNSSSGSVASLTEEDLLEATGQTVRPDASRVGYNDLIPGTSRHRASGAAAEAEASTSSAPKAPKGDGFTEVPLKQRRGQHANSYNYKIKVFTADKLNAGLGKSTVHVELLGREATVAQALPRGKGSFQRGCVDRFTLYSQTGDMGQILALKVWHEGKTLGPGNWGFEQLVIDDRLKGNRYVFRNTDPECVLRKGRRHCLVLKPEVSRIDESEDLAEVAREYETQLAANRDLNEVDRAGLRGKLEKINQRLSKLGSKLARSVSGSFGWK